MPHPRGAITLDLLTVGERQELESAWQSVASEDVQGEARMSLTVRALAHSGATAVKKKHRRHDISAGSATSVSLSRTTQQGRCCCGCMCEAV